MSSTQPSTPDWRSAPANEREPARFPPFAGTSNRAGSKCRKASEVETVQSPQLPVVRSGCVHSTSGWRYVDTGKLLAGTNEPPTSAPKSPLMRNNGDSYPNLELHFRHRLPYFPCHTIFDQDDPTSIVFSTSTRFSPFV